MLFRCQSPSNQDSFLGVNIPCIARNLFKYSCGCYEYDSITHRYLTYITFILYSLLVFISTYLLLTALGLIDYYHVKLLCSYERPLYSLFICFLPGFFIILALVIVCLILYGAIYGLYSLCFCIKVSSIGEKPSHLQPLIEIKVNYNTCTSTTNPL